MTYLTSHDGCVSVTFGNQMVALPARSPAAKLGGHVAHHPATEAEGQDLVKVE